MTCELTKRILESLNEEVLSNLRLASAIAHPGESGRAREDAIRIFLRKLLPEGYGISTGFVIDGQGAISRQVDVIIHRTGYHPVFEIGGVKHFMVESVVAVLENKATVGKRELRMALENIKSVKALDRSSAGQNYEVDGTRKGAAVNRDSPRHQVLGAVVAGESISRPEVVMDRIAMFCDKTHRRYWPNLYVDSSRFAVIHRKPEETPEGMRHVLTWTDTHESDGLFLFKPSADDPTSQPLVLLARALASSLRVLPLLDYKPSDYFGIGTNPSVSMDFES